MELRPGYKQTEVGIIPEDWEVANTLDLSRQIMDFRGRTPKKLGMDWGGGTIPAISAANVKKGFIDFTEECNFGCQELYQKWMTRGDVRKGDIVFTTEAPLGNVALVPDEQKYILSQRTILLQIDPLRASSEFLFQMMLSDVFQRALKDYSSGSTAKGIQRKTFEQLSVPLPPLPEQRTIATALSDVDALLDALKRLIAKKRDLKQAAMQQLLTGRTRLPGFHGEWEESTVGREFDVALGKMLDAERNSGTPKPYVGNRAVQWGRVDTAELQTVRLSSADMERYRLEKGDLLVCEGGEVGRAAIWTAPLEECYYQKALHRLRPRRGMNSHFMAATLELWAKRGALDNYVTQTSIAHLPREKFIEVPLRAPSVPEQNAIATILSDMDAELTALDVRLDKTRALKQAMMQELLTGSTRLIALAVTESPKASNETDGRQANIHFKRSVLAAEIIDRLHDEQTFGHVKFEKMIYLLEHLCNVDTGSTYHRDAAGPYDNRAMRSIDSQLRTQKWFDAQKIEGRYRYQPMANRGKHKEYFERYFGGIGTAFDTIIETFRGFTTERCEIVATLFSAWNDLLQQKGPISDDAIVNEVLNNWHESKKRIPEHRWRKALSWMRDHGFVPRNAAGAV